MTVGERLAVLEERMETEQAEYRTDFASVAQMVERNRGEYKTAIADLAATIERRDKENIRWIAALVLGAALLVIAALKSRHRRRTEKSR